MSTVIAQFDGTNGVTIGSTDSTGAQASGTSTSASISADGTLVAFQSGASNLVDGDTNGVAAREEREFSRTDGAARVIRRDIGLCCIDD